MQMAAEAMPHPLPPPPEASAPGALWPPTTTLRSAALQPQDEGSGRGCRLQALVR